VSQNGNYDFLVLGQGLAGSLLAWRLLRRGRRVLVLDDGHRTAASLVAAGLINPLAGMRFNHSPHVRHWLEAVERIYGELEEAAGRPFLHWQPMVRLFRSPEQVRFYERKAALAENRWLFGERFPPESSGEPVHALHGGFFQKRTGHLDLPALLAFLSGWLEERGALRREAVDHARLAVTPDGIRYGELEAAHLVCCEGYRGMDNPWFGHLPFAPDKGEFLVLEREPGAGDTDLPRTIVNGAHWLLPHADGRYRLGSTHDHRHLDQAPTAEGRKKLEEGMRKLLLHPDALRLHDHQAGVRPATSDRQPFLGTHPDHPRLHLFNGFGAHGSISIPWYSERMVAWLLDSNPLPENADLNRFHE